MAFLAPSLDRLFDEVNARWPARDKWSDGWLGDTSHSHRFSDHNPDGRGMVHAVDIDATLTRMTMGSGTVGDFVLSELLKRCRDGRLDQVIHYLIYKGRIYSSSTGYSARIYTGINAHTSHVHVSIHYTRTAEQFAGSWGIRDSQTDWFEDMATKADLREVVDAAINAAKDDIANSVRAELVERLGQDDSSLSARLRRQVRTAVSNELDQRK